MVLLSTAPDGSSMELLWELLFGTFIFLGVTVLSHIVVDDITSKHPNSQDKVMGVVLYRSL